MPRAKNVDEYIAAHPAWDTALRKLRKVLLDTEMVETIKWGAPVYTVGGKNVVGLGAFKEHCGLWFFEGVHLRDPDGVLINAQDGKTKALRQMRFGDAREILVKRVKAYVQEAIANQRAGVVTRPERGKAVEVPPELEAALRRNRKARSAFASMTPGKQREYCEHIASGKREATRAARLEKALPLIEQGAGLNDKYRSC